MSKGFLDQRGHITGENFVCQEPKGIMGLKVGDGGYHAGNRDPDAYVDQ